MKRSQKFVYCRHCGNMAGVVVDAGVPMICCGEKMSEIIPNTSEGAGEKHLPVVKADGNRVTVSVGSVTHPSDAVHHIRWIYLETEHGGQRRILEPGEAPEAVFELVNDRPVAAFAYCNLHGLWQTSI